MAIKENTLLPARLAPLVEERPMRNLAILLGIGGVLLSLIALLRARFLAEISALERAVAAAPPSSASAVNLPPAIRALALRHGARGAGGHPAVFSQVGFMWSEPGGRAMPFRAWQTSAATDSAFVWRARFQPFGAIVAADYLTPAAAGLRVRVLGAIAIVNAVQTQEVRRGQLLRYLAELPWVPDSFLHNRAIDWRVEGPERLVAGIGTGADRIAVTFMLGADGRIAGAECPARPRLEGRGSRERPWGGRFWDYREIEGRMIPTRAEVYWVIDGQRFVYWAGRIETWSSGAN